ncbi:MAG: PKD domain-containing protein, partial [Candidatus Thermoplasmatota archaeon]|nr:PKD domain-containing protein [Candidatus Thermoplasmatota archaeon]
DTMTVTVDDIYNPVAVSQGDMEISKDTNVVFNGTGSHDSSGIKEYHWTFDFHGEDIHLTGPTPNFTFTRTGIFQVTLKVIDNYDHFGETIFNVSVPDVDRPVVDAGEDITVDNGDTVDLDGSGTTDDSGIANYTWSFRYNGNLIFIDGMVQSFLFEIPGVYDVTLTVTDVFGNTGSDSITVTVRDTIPPVAKIVGSHTLLDGEICNLDGTKSTDNGKIVKYVWTFTDDKIYNFEEEKMLYDFKVKGYHNITLTVWDEFNLSDSTWVIVEVVDTTSPVANAGEDQTIGAGQTITFNGSASTDDGTIVSWEWNFEYDGEQKELEGEKAEFTLYIPGEYSVLLTVFDQSGNYGEDTVLITVTGAIDDDDDDIKDNNTEETEKEFPILLVIIPLVIVVLLIIGIVVFLIMRKKKPEEDQPKEEEKDDLEDMLDSLPEEEPALSDQEQSIPPEPENIIDQEGAFDDYNLPDDTEAPLVEEPSEDIPSDP